MKYLDAAGKYNVKKAATKIKLKSDRRSNEKQKMSFITQIYTASYFLTSDNIASSLLSNIVYVQHFIWSIDTKQNSCYFCVASALVIMYFIQIFSISIDTVALRNICYAMAGIAIKHMCTLSEFYFILFHRFTGQHFFNEK